jgi:hypothetical protein
MEWWSGTTNMGMARSMLKAMEMSGWLWGVAVAKTVYVLNRLPTQSVNSRTPYEVWHDIKPKVHHLHTFGCIAHVKQGNKQLMKLEDRSTLMVFVGYELGSKAWRFYNPITKHVHVSHNAVFKEDQPWKWSCVEREHVPVTRSRSQSSMSPCVVRLSTCQARC